MTKFLNISTDDTLGGVSPSDEIVVSQKAIKTYVDNQGGGGGSGYHPDLFDWKWADYEISDMQWLRADTFSWQNGTTYSQAYQHLVSDISGVTPTTETVAGTTITFYLAADGHKIVDSTQETNVVAIYAATGVAWYYILDTVNQQFKLPRTKFGATGLRDTVGNYVEAGLPTIGKIQHVMFSNSSQTDNDAITFNDEGRIALSSGGGNEWVRTVDVGGGNSIFGNSTTVQPPATQMYLYFYVGSFTESAVENTAGLNASLFNNKADLDFGNTLMIDYVVAKQDPSSANDYTWYRKYKSGWVEQGGIVPKNTGTSGTITLPVEMANVYYTVTSNTGNNGANNFFNVDTQEGNITTTTMKWYKSSTALAGSWQVSGMAA